jgi:hypothetical protein
MPIRTKLTWESSPSGTIVAATESGVKSERYRCYLVWIIGRTGVSLNVCWIRYGGDSSARGSLTRSSAVARSFI